MRKTSKKTVAAVVAGLLVATAAVTSGTPAAADPRVHDTKVNRPDRRITLVTGDRVTVHGGDLRRVSVDRGPGRKQVSFRVFRSPGRLQVLPLDVSAAVASGRLDARLFDVSGLLAMGYDDASTPSIPLLVGTPAVGARSSMPGAIVRRELPEAGLTAMTVDKKSAATFLTRTRSARSESGTIWLDAKRRTSLDQSVPRIGAPAAWKKGFTGKGVRVAVVDTGIDAAHPDLKGQVVAAKNFTDGPAGDGNGHGTHVGSTIAGTAVASKGRYKGVAPGAKLVDAQVCDGEGNCDESSILAGMEWAAVQQKARVINLSLGGPDDPAVDPLEAAVARLTKQTGALFVVAAGNEGPAPGTVDSPGSSPVALTVGAVDKADGLADFSGRSIPGAALVKPDVTAPGVAIVAARAKGTALGDPVDRWYTALDGTSMATPHTAGSAALLAQQHPAWKAADLKAALTGTAERIAGQTSYQQGSGRIDAANGTRATVAALGGVVSFGTALWPHHDDKPVRKPVTYRNFGTKPVTLSLSVRGEVAGKPAPATAFAVSPAELTISPGRTATATVTSNTRHGGPDAVYSGRVTATAPGFSLGTTLVVIKEVESYDVTVRHVLPGGKGAGSTMSFLFDLGRQERLDLVTGPSGATKVRLRKGEYLLDGSLTDADERVYKIVWPKFTVDKAITLRVDARQAKPVRITMPARRPAVEPRELELSYNRQLKDSFFDSSLFVPGPDKLAMASAGGAVPAGEMTTYLSGRWAVPGKDRGFADSPYSYNLIQGRQGGFMDGFDRTVRDSELAKVTSRYHADRPGGLGLDEPFGTYAGLGASSASQPLRYTLPTTATHYFDTKDVAWSAGFSEIVTTEAGQEYPLVLNTTDDQRYQPGRSYQERWGAAVSNAGIGFGGTTRQGDDLVVWQPPNSDADGHAGSSLTAEGSTTLYRDGKLVESADSAGDLTVSLPAAESAYRLETVHVRKYTQLASRLEHTWTFRSKNTGDKREPLPIRSIDFEPLVDANNAVLRTPLSTLRYRLVGQPGAALAPVKSVAVWVSGDAGKTWQPTKLTSRAAVFTTPPGAKTISLKSAVVDQAGNTSTQLIHHAYRIR